MTTLVLFSCLACLVASNLALESDWNQEMRNYITDIHNEYRRNEGGCQMNELEYDTALEEHAKYWAERCVFKHEYGGYGENLAYNSNQNPEKDLIKDAAKGWFDEKSNYSYGQESCGSPLIACHYTQMVWATTQKFGCYTTRCSTLWTSGGKRKDFWYFVCFYTPRGNWAGQNPYNKSCDVPCPEGRYLENGLCVTGEPESGSSSNGNIGEKTGKAICVDKDEMRCEKRAKLGKCKTMPKSMLKNCKKSCKVCTPDEAGETGGEVAPQRESESESKIESGGDNNGRGCNCSCKR